MDAPAPDARRDALLDAGLALLAARGEAGVTLEGVARHAGTSKGLVLYHFGTRKRFLDALGERLLADARAGLARIDEDYPRPRVRADAILDALFEEPPALDREGVRHVLAFWLAPGRNDQRVTDLTATLARALHEAARRTGGARAHRTREAAAALAVQQWLGALTAWVSGVDVDFELARRSAGERVEDALAGARKSRR